MNKDQIIKALVDRLNAVHNTIDSATESLDELKFNDLDAFQDLIGELAPTEELLIEVGKQLSVANDVVVSEVSAMGEEIERITQINNALLENMKLIRQQLIDGGRKEDSITIMSIDVALKHGQI